LRIALLREAGGIGDVIRCFPVVAGLRKKYPEAEIHAFVLSGYQDLWKHCEPKPDAIIPVAGASRRSRDWFPSPNVTSKEIGEVPAGEKCFYGHSSPLSPCRVPEPAKFIGKRGDKYRLKLLRSGEIVTLKERDRVHFLSRGPAYDWVVDLFCPAYRHEVETRGDITKDRIQLFCEAAGVEPSTPRFRIDEDDLEIAKEWIRRHGLDDGAPIIGLQPFAQAESRNWPAENWARLSEILQAVGFHTIVFDSKRRRKVPASVILGHHIRGWFAGPLGALVWLLDLMVTPDSGLFHLSGAVGTPAIGLFGSFDGEIMSRFYPTHTWLYPDGFVKGKKRAIPVERNGKLLYVQECSPPCIGRWEKGFRWSRCNRMGCAYLAKLKPERVAEKVMERIAELNRAEVLEGR